MRQLNMHIHFQRLAGRFSKPNVFLTDSRGTCIININDNKRATN